MKQYNLTMNYVLGGCLMNYVGIVVVAPALPETLAEGIKTIEAMFPGAQAVTLQSFCFNGYFAT